MIKIETHSRSLIFLASQRGSSNEVHLILKIFSRLVTADETLILVNGHSNTH